jgi:acetyl-CoA C-acetyltransferase
VDDHTPIIIGVGEASERIDSADYEALSPVELASRAAAAAVADAGGRGVAAAIQTLAAIRQFEVSGPNAPASRAGSGLIRRTPSWSRWVGKGLSIW